MASQGTPSTLSSPLTPSTPITPAVQTKPSTTHSFRLPDPSQLSICKGPSTTPPSSCYNLEDVVTILVKDGQKRREYTVLRGLVIWHSSYFAAALDPEGGWSQDGERKLTLDCAHATFDAFCCWLFTSKLKDPVTNAILANNVFLSVRVLVDIWIFADFHGIPALGNSAIEMMHERIVAEWTLPCHIIKHAYRNTLAGSKLRGYLVELYKMSAELDAVTAKPSSYTEEFLCDVLPALARRERRLRGSVTSVDRCQWHDHSGPGGKLRLESR
ncbi:hypothetical protein EKO04_009994 [Ascochyta lentis]|uniref:BTB domain-containing protein n=1 Tax=Ascochyta lentis TaxID=205686 RepID=A0A8H7IT39_9PLEO|nr:hypothetical protein EKO04_009994 [Ascochyta lentis]